MGHRASCLFCDWELSEEHCKACPGFDGVELIPCRQRGTCTRGKARSDISWDYSLNDSKFREFVGQKTGLSVEQPRFASYATNFPIPLSSPREKVHLSRLASALLVAFTLLVTKAQAHCGRTVVSSLSCDKTALHTVVQVSSLEIVHGDFWVWFDLIVDITYILIVFQPYHSK